MDISRFSAWKALVVLALAVSLGSNIGCTPGTTAMNETQLTEFATRYAQAWSSQDPARLASFYAESGSLIVNDGEPSVGRAAVTETARAFMTAFPDMLVVLDRVERKDGVVEFHWIWTGTNTGPGGTGKSVRMVGYEAWTLDTNGLIARSEGHYDEAEYQRQLREGAPPPGTASGSGSF